MSTITEDLQRFIEGWQTQHGPNKPCFLELKTVLEQLKDITLEFKQRQGITHSLRAHHANQKDKPLFIMVDVIEGEPRWLSVCSYADMITDPEGRGDFVPQGLLGEDAICFDLEEYEEDALSYIKERVNEAYLCAARAG